MKPLTVPDEQRATLADWVQCYGALIYRNPYAMTLGLSLSADDRERFPILCKLIDSERASRNDERLCDEYRTRAG